MRRSARTSVRTAGRSSSAISAISTRPSSSAAAADGGVGAGQDHAAVAGEPALQQIARRGVAGDARVEAAEEQLDDAPRDLRREDALGRRVERADVQRARVAQRGARGARRERLVQVDEVERRDRERLLDRARDVDRQRGDASARGRERQHLADAEHAIRLAAATGSSSASGRSLAAWIALRDSRTSALDVDGAITTTRWPRLASSSAQRATARLTSCGASQANGVTWAIARRSGTPWRIDRGLCPRREPLLQVRAHVRPLAVDHAVPRGVAVLPSSSSVLAVDPLELRRQRRHRRARALVARVGLQLDADAAGLRRTRARASAASPRCSRPFPRPRARATSSRSRPSGRARAARGSGSSRSRRRRRAHGRERHLAPRRDAAAPPSRRSTSRTISDSCSGTGSHRDTRGFDAAARRSATCRSASGSSDTSEPKSEAASVSNTPAMIADRAGGAGEAFRELARGTPHPATGPARSRVRTQRKQARSRRAPACRASRRAAR